MAPVRRSGRERRATKQSLEGLERFEAFSNDDSEGFQEEVEQIVEHDEVSQDSEYVVDDEGPLEEEEQDDVSMEDEYQNADEDNSEDAFSESDEEIDILRRRWRINIDDHDGLMDGSTLFNRSNHEDFHSKGKLERYASLYGSEREDLMGALKGRDKWSHNAIFPNRQVDEKGSGGFHESYLRSEEAAHAEATEDWEWYFEGGGRTNIERHQKLRDLDKSSGMECVTPTSGPSSKLLMGPRAKQKLVTVDTREWVRIEDIWREAEQAIQSQTRKGKAKRGCKEGWIFNAGTTVQDVTWVPVRQRHTQFLALTTALSINEERVSTGTEDEESDSATAVAFSPSEPLPACIQFWAIPSSTEPEREGCMDYTSTPKLSFVLCTNWGMIKQMKWCPAPRDNRDELVDFALLAGVWGDGKVRLVKVAIPDEDEEEEEISTLYIKVENVAFEACPPDTICTCVDWLSASHIAVGCANGFVAIWDLADHICPASSSLSSPNTNPRAYFYQPVHQTYILAILSCYPSHPDCLLTTSMDGYVRLTSVHCPDTDYALAPRSRTGIAALAWSDVIQCAFSPEDNNIIRALALRRFYSSFNMVRHPAEVLSLALGITHTSLLAGGADGTVLAFNPLRRLLYPRAANRHVTWFLHEWSRRDGGISRFTEGFKSVCGPNPRIFREGLEITTTTLYEPKSAITHLAWNPNVRCGSWAVAAMGDGIVRVEDLAV